MFYIKYSLTCFSPKEFEDKLMILLLIDILGHRGLIKPKNDKNLRICS